MLDGTYDILPNITSGAAYRRRNAMFGGTPGTKKQPQLFLFEPGNQRLNPFNSISGAVMITAVGVSLTELPPPSPNVQVKLI